MFGKESAEAPKQLEWACKTLEAAGFEAPAALVPGDAESVIETVDMSDAELNITFPERFFTP